MFQCKTNIKVVKPWYFKFKRILNSLYRPQHSALSVHSCTVPDLSLSTQHCSAFWDPTSQEFSLKPSHVSHLLKDGTLRKTAFNTEHGFACIRSLMKHHTMEYIWLSLWTTCFMVRAKNLTNILHMCQETRKWKPISLLPVSCTSPLKNNGFSFKIPSVFSVLLFFALLRIFICVISQLSNTCFRIAFKRLLWYEKKNCSLHEPLFCFGMAH